MTTPHCPLVLVVDDDPEIRELLGHYLTQNGFCVAHADGGPALREAMASMSPDVLVLDLMMPGEDGLSLTRWLKANWDIPVIMLSARGEEMDRVIGLEVGADDYLAKPFSPRELLARLRALLRRHPQGASTPSSPAPVSSTDPPSTNTLGFGPYRLDTAGRTLRKGDDTIALTGAEYDLLLALVQRPGRVLSRDQLIGLIKGYERDAFDRSIDNRVTRLRRKIEHDPTHPTYLLTVRGEGYLFNPQGDAA